MHGSQSIIIVSCDIITTVPSTVSCIQQQAVIVRYWYMYSNAIFTYVVYAEKYKDICFEVHGECSEFTPPLYFIDGNAPNPSEYNVTYARGAKAKVTFCLKNVTTKSVVTETCEYLPQRSFCQYSPGELVFLSRTEIHLYEHQQENITSITVTVT